MCISLLKINSVDDLLNRSYIIISLLRSALLGIGRIPHTVMYKLKNRRDLGIHSEMLSDAVMKLFESGQVTNAKKV